MKGCEVSPKSRAVAFTAVVLAVLVSGCGGGGSSGTTDRETTSTDRTLTKADWTRQADAVCRKALRSDGPIATEASPDLLTSGRALLQRIGTELEALPVPPREATQIDRLMRALGAAVGLMEEERRRTAGSGDLQPIELDRVLTAVGAPIATMDKEFSAYGAQACGEVTLGFPSG